MPTHKGIFKKIIKPVGRKLVGKRGRRQLKRAFRTAKRISPITGFRRVTGALRRKVRPR